MADARVSVLIDLRSRLQGLEAASRGFTNLIKLATGFAASYIGVRTVLAGARDIIGLGAELNHLAAQTGIAEGELLTLRQAFSDNGVAIDQVGPSVNKMQRQMVQAARTGTGPVADAFRDMNLRVEDLLRLSPAEQFDAISRGLAGIEDPAVRNAAAMSIFGEQGAKLMPLFRTGGALDDARASLGAMPGVLERNAVEFERIDTLMGRIPNKSRQIFAGIADQLASEILGPMEALNRIDLTALGQRIGAFIGLGLDSIRDGSFGQFISLAIEAGFEQGVAGAQRVWDAAVGNGSGGLWRSALAAVMTFGVKTAETLVDAFDGPIAYLSAGFRWVASQTRYGFEVAANGLSGAFGSVINFVAGGFEALLNLIIAKVNQITAYLPFTDGTQIGEVSIGRVEWGQGEVEGPAAFGSLLDEQREGVASLGAAIKNNLNANLDESRRILGIGGDELGKQQTATERLNALIQERIALRENEGREPAAGASTFSTDSPDIGAPAVRSQNFADTSAERFSQFTGSNADGSAFQGDRSDFGVGAIDAARASLQDFVVEMGTVAQQVYATVGGIASSLRDAIGGSITGLINGTMTWGGALRSIGGSVVQSIIKGFADMAAAWIVKQVMMFALGQKLKAADSATTAAKGAADAAAMAPAATMASIASFGAAAAIGLALVLGALAVFGGFAEGGYTGPGGKYAPAGIVHAGEDVFSQANIALWGGGRDGLRNVELLRTHGPDALPLVANRTGYGQEMVSRLRVDRSGYAMGGIVGGKVTLPEIQQEVAQNRSSEPGGSQREAPQRRQQFIIVDSRRIAERMAEEPNVESHIVETVRRNRAQII